MDNITEEGYRDIGEQPYVPETPNDTSNEDWRRSDLFNLYNPFFGTTYNTGLNQTDSWSQEWEPDKTEWVNSLDVEDKMAVSRANSEEYAKQIMNRRLLYKESQQRVAADESIWPTVGGFVAGAVDPTIMLPVGVTAMATKTAYTLGAKATRLAAISAESAAVSMASISFANAAEKGHGLDGHNYGTLNLYAGLIGGGLPVIGSMLSGGYNTAKIAKSMTTDPKNFVALTGELTADALGGTQLKSLYSKIMPRVLQSDVTFTAASDNKYITLISNRIDSPPMAVVDRNTGKPVPIPTTGQDYKSKLNGLQRIHLSDMRGLQTESTIKDLDDFMLEVGKVNRKRAVEQEQATYQELEDHIAFTENEVLLRNKAERDTYVNEELAYYKNEEGKDIFLTSDELAVVERDRAAVDNYNQEKANYDAQIDALAQEELDYINSMLEQYKAEGKSPKELKAIKKDLLDTVKEANKDVLPLEPIVPTPEFKYAVNTKKRTKKDITKYDEDLKARSDEEISKAIDAKKDELYDAHQIEFQHRDPKVVEAASKMDNYYKAMLEEGKRLKIHELGKVNKNKHYMTRIFDFQKIREISMGDLVTKLERGLKSHAAYSKAAADDITKAATEMATQLKQLDYTKDWADFSFFVPKELGSTAFIKHKKLKLNDSAIEDILVTNAEDVMGQYSYAQIGHYSANNAFPELQGIPRKEQLDKFHEGFIKPLIETGADPKEVQALKNMFEDMLGSFRIAKNSNSAAWKGTRIANSINSLTYGAGFVLNTAAELGGLLLDGHVKNIMKTKLGTLKEVGTMFNGKTIEDPIVRDFVIMGQMENLFSTNNMMKMSDTDTVFNVGAVENTLNKGTNEFFKYTGLRGATVALEAIVGPKVIHDILEIGRKTTLPLAQQKYMARIGLSHEDAKIISRELDSVGKFNKAGKIYDLNLDKWSEELADKVTTAVGRGMRHTVIKGDTTYLPSWMINPNTGFGAFPRLIFQFLRYPMAATETLLARGLNESTSRWMAATGTSALMMSMVIYGREQASLAIGALDERDAKYDNFWEDEEAAMKLFTVAFAKVGTLGGSSIMVDKLSAATGVPAPGSEYVHPDVLSTLGGPTFSRFPQLRAILEPLLTEGRIDDKKQWNAMMGLIPGATAPIISEWLRSEIKENTY